MLFEILHLAICCWSYLHLHDLILEILEIEMAVATTFIITERRVIERMLLRQCRNFWNNWWRCLAAIIRSIVHWNYWHQCLETAPWISSKMNATATKFADAVYAVLIVIYLKQMLLTNKFVLPILMRNSVKVRRFRWFYWLLHLVTKYLTGNSLARFNSINSCCRQAMHAFV
jgi:hypothetical protein